MWLDPTNRNPHWSYGEIMCSYFNDVLLEVCSKRSLRCLDLALAVPRSATPFYDDVHFTEAGSRIVADAFVDFLLKK